MTITRRNFLTGAGGLAASLALPQVVTAGSHNVIKGRAFGTDWQLTMAASPDAQRLARDVSALLEQLEECLSPFRRHSEVTRVNAIAGPRSCRLSPTLMLLMQQSLAIARLTDGAFDPTVGPAVARFGFGPIMQSHRAGGSPNVDYRGLKLSGRGLTKTTPSLTFDPCGAGKGYALERIGKYLRGAGIANFLIEFGGDILAGGRHSRHRLWRIGIENPSDNAQNLRESVALGDCALATSGDRINAYSINGRRYSHIIDPATGVPVDHAVSSVSAIAADAVTADGLATALMAMGLDRGSDFAEKHDVACMFILRAGNHLSSRKLAGFEKYIVSRG